MNDDFKDRLKYLIDNIVIDGKRVTSYKIEKETGIKRQSIESYLKGIQQPLGNTVIKIANLFGVSVRWLLEGEGNMLNDSSQETDNNKKNETIEVSAEAWNIIKTQAEVMSLQAKSLDKRDNQIDELINMLKKGKEIVPPEDTAGCADVVV